MNDHFHAGVFFRKGRHHAGKKVRGESRNHPERDSSGEEIFGVTGLLFRGVDFFKDPDSPLEEGFSIRCEACFTFGTVEESLA